MGYVRGIKYQYQSQSGGWFISSENPNLLLDAKDTYIQCKNGRVPYISGLIQPIDGSWCECISEDPVTFMVSSICYFGVTNKTYDELNFIRSKIEPIYGKLSDYEAEAFQKALYCVTRYIDAENCENMLDRLCDYLMLDWDTEYTISTSYRNTMELRFMIHSILFGWEEAVFISNVIQAKEKIIISATVGTDGKIHLLFDGRDVHKMFECVVKESGSSTSSVKDLLNKASGDKESQFPAYDQADLFLDWFSELAEEHKGIVRRINADVWDNAVYRAKEHLRRDYRYRYLMDIMYRVYDIIKCVKDPIQMYFMKEMYILRTPADWKIVKDSDLRLYCALCSGECLDPNIYNKEMLDLMRAQFTTPLANVKDLAKYDCLVLFKWVEYLSEDNLNLAIECNEEAITAAYKKDYDWFQKSNSPKPLSIMRTYYDRQSSPATPDWAYAFYDKLYNSNNSVAWNNLIGLDTTLFKAVANCLSLTSGEYTSGILENVSNKIFTE